MDNPQVKKYIEQLQDKDNRGRANIAIALGKFADPSAIPALIDALQDGDKDVQESAARALKQMGIPAVAAITTLRERYRKKPDNASVVLDEIHIPTISVLIHVMGRHPTPQIRLQMATAIEQIGLPAVPDLIQELADQDSRVRVEAAKILVKIGDASAIPVLISLLRDKDWIIRNGALAALEQIGLPAVPELIKVLADRGSWFRVKVAAILGQLGDPAAIPILIEVLREPQTDLHASAVAALEKLGMPAVPELSKVLTDQASLVRVEIATVLGQFGDTYAVPALIDALKDKDGNLRENAAIALEKIGDFKTFPRRILSDSRFSAQERIEILEKLRSHYRWQIKTFFYAFPDTLSLCQAMLDGGDARERAGAQTVLNWLNRDRDLLQASQAANDNNALLIPTKGGESEVSPSTLLHGSELPEQPPERRPLWQRLLGTWRR